MKTELINLFKTGRCFDSLPMERKVFYEGITRGEYKDFFIEVVQIFLFKSNGQLALQKRSETKNHNPGLLDKSIGGHVTCGFTPKLTVMGETIQELGTPAYVADNPNEFGMMLEILREHTNTVSLVQHVDTIDIRPVKIIGGERFNVGNRSHIYFGIYDGPIDFKDSEAAGINYFSLEELESKIKNDHSLFTDDMHLYLDIYGSRMYDFIANWL